MLENKQHVLLLKPTKFEKCRRPCAVLPHSAVNLRAFTIIL